MIVMFVRTPTLQHFQHVIRNSVVENGLILHKLNWPNKAKSDYEGAQQ